MMAKKYIKVKDHCQYTEKYRGAAHDICNLRYKTQKKIPAVFHNVSTFLLDRNDKIMKMSHKTESIDSFKFMSSSLLSLADNLSEGIHNEKCTNCKSCLDYMTTQDDQLIFRCFDGKTNDEKDFNKESIKRFANIYKFCNEDINKFILLLRKGIYPYEYMDSWERFVETSLPDKAF